MTSTTSLQHFESACRKHRQSPVAAAAPAFICRARPRGERSTRHPASSSTPIVLQRWPPLHCGMAGRDCAGRMHLALAFARLKAHVELPERSTAVKVRRMLL